MKILLFSTGFIEFVIELANGLSKQETTILMLPKNHIKNVHLDYISNDVIFEPFYMPRQRYPTCLLMMRKIVKTILKHNPDVIHIQAHGHSWFFVGFPFLKRYPIINSIHDIKPHKGDKWSKGYKFSTKFGNKHTDQFIVHGRLQQTDLVKLYGISENLVNVIPLGNLSLFKKWQTKELEEIPNTILYFGRIWRYKGLDYLIKAEPLISKKIPDMKIIIAGRGENFDKYKQLMVHKNKFIIKNYNIPNEEVTELFQIASVVVLPYLEATQSGVIPLAYSFRKPVVVTDVGSLSEVVENGKTGFIVPPKDENALADAVIKLLKDDELRQRMGQNAYKYAITELSWERIANMTIKVYKKAINRIST